MYIYMPRTSGWDNGLISRGFCMFSPIRVGSYDFEGSAS